MKDGVIGLSAACIILLSIGSGLSYGQTVQASKMETQMNMSSERGRILYQQQETIYLKCARADKNAPDYVEHATPNQEKATAIRISGYVRPKGVTGPRDHSFVVVTNLTYERTPIFWDTILYPQVGATPWQYMEKYIRPRLPIRKIDVFYRLQTKGEAWFRDFKIEEVPAWKEDADIVVAMLGASTTMMAYIPDYHTVWYRLEELLRDRFPDHHIRIRSLAQSGEYLKTLLETGRLERELNTLERCDFMYIRYGYNDAGKRIKPADFKQQLFETCDRVLKKFPDCQIVLGTPTARIPLAFADMTREVARERNYPLVDIGGMFMREVKRGNGNWHRAYKNYVGYRTEELPPWNPTGLGGDRHQNAYGGQLMAEAKFKVIAPLIARKLDLDPVQ